LLYFLKPPVNIFETSINTAFFEAHMDMITKNVIQYNQFLQTLNANAQKAVYFAKVKAYTFVNVYHLG
jgi:hypothetical protein